MTVHNHYNPQNHPTFHSEERFFKLGKKTRVLFLVCLLISLCQYCTCTWQPSLHLPLRIINISASVVQEYMTSSWKHTPGYHYNKSLHICWRKRGVYYISAQLFLGLVCTVGFVNICGPFCSKV